MTTCYSTSNVDIMEHFIDFIQEELSKADSASSTTITVTPLENHRITMQMELPPLEPLFRIDGKPCFFRGEMTAIAGKAKSGKTFFTSVLMACCAKSGILGIERIQEQPLHVLWYDTEQSMQSTQEILRDRIMPLIGGREEFPEPLFDIFNVRAVHWDQRMDLLRQGIKAYHPDFVVVDGLRDLVDDINNGVLAQAVTDDLMNIASEENCCIVCVIHQNKAGEDRNLRGWIGTELTNKAFEIWNCEKVLPDEIFGISQIQSRKAGISKTVYFDVDRNGLPELSDGPSQESASTTANYKQKKQLPPLNQEYVIHHDDDDTFEIDIRKLFYDTLKGGAMYYSPMQQKAMSLLNCQDSGYWNSIFLKAKELGIVQNITVNRKSMWSLPDRKEAAVKEAQLEMFTERPADESLPY